MDAVRVGNHRSRICKQTTYNVPNDESSDDDYHYNMVDDAQDADNDFTRTMPYISQRYIGSRRAKPPTDIDPDL